MLFYAALISPPFIPLFWKLCCSLAAAAFAAAATAASVAQHFIHVGIVCLARDDGGPTTLFGCQCSIVE